ncbi:accessory Sec system glycosylation chaperone GtfB [Hutsoniella sourekii]
MFNLFDQYHDLSRDLHQSLKRAGFDYSTIVINEDGFLPEGVTSPYRYYMGEETGIPLYFNQVQIPDRWEVHATSSSAQIKDYHRLKGTIYYNNPGSNSRFVQNVDWYDEAGKVAWSDCYNQFGRHFATVSYSSQGHALVKTYFDIKGQEVLIEHLTTGQIELLQDGKLQVFANKASFICHFLEELGLLDQGMIINSLSTPFFVSHQLPARAEDILVWQEPLGGEIPGNMQLIFKEETPRAKRIVVPDQETYQRLLALAEGQALASDQVYPLGYLYPFIERQGMTKDALILTNSDQIERLEELLEGLPDLHSHIAAVTEMSNKLMNFDAYENVSLYPSAPMAKIKQLLRQSAYYLDINHGNEIVEAVRAAFEYQALVLAFKETQHQTVYLDPANCYASDDYQDLISKLHHLLADEQAYWQALGEQVRASNCLTPESFQTAWQDITANR